MSLHRGFDEDGYEVTIRVADSNAAMLVDELDALIGQLRKALARARDAALRLDLVSDKEQQVAIKAYLRIQENQP
jgi:hypothetical protein